MKSTNLLFRIMLVAILLPLVSCTTNKPKPLTVLSYNIHHGAGMDTILDLERIAGVINSVSPDMVALQEIDVLTERNGNVHQMQVLAKLTNMNFAFGKSIDLQGGQYGNGVLTKFPIINQKTYPLPGNEPRCALAVTMEIETEKEIVLISTHLATEEKGRLASLEPIRAILKDFAELPIIFAGDFNALPASEVLASINESLNDATVGLKTYPVDEPSRQIDYIMYGPKDNWSVDSSMVLDEKVASDHRPILSVLILK